MKIPLTRPGLKSAHSPTTTTTTTPSKRRPTDESSAPRDQSATSFDQRERGPFGTDGDERRHFPQKTSSSMFNEPRRWPHDALQQAAQSRKSPKKWTQFYGEIQRERERESRPLSCRWRRHTAKSGNIGGAISSHFIFIYSKDWRELEAAIESFRDRRSLRSIDDENQIKK